MRIQWIDRVKEVLRVVTYRSSPDRPGFQKVGYRSPNTQDIQRICKKLEVSNDKDTQEIQELKSQLAEAIQAAANAKLALARSEAQVAALSAANKAYQELGVALGHTSEEDPEAVQGAVQAPDLIQHMLEDVRRYRESFTSVVDAASRTGLWPDQLAVSDFIPYLGTKYKESQNKLYKARQHLWRFQGAETSGQNPAYVARMEEYVRSVKDRCGSGDDEGLRGMLSNMTDHAIRSSCPVILASTVGIRLSITPYDNGKYFRVDVTHPEGKASAARVPPSKVRYTALKLVRKVNEGLN